MTPDKTAILLMEYLDGTLSEDARQELEFQLKQDAELRQELATLKAVLTQMEQLPEEQPSVELDQRFNQYLLGEQSRLKSPNWRGRIFSFHALPRIELQAAAAIALLLVGLGFGWFWRVNQRQQAEIVALRDEMHSTQKMLVLSMLEQPSASERIQAVNVLEEQKHADPEVLKALIHTLTFDDMVNVRMKAAQALSTFADEPAARKALINSLSSESSPEVQITIIELLVELGDKRALPTLRSVSEDEKKMDFVRQQAASGVERLL